MYERRGTIAATIAALLFVMSVSYAGISGTGKENSVLRFGLLSLMATDAPVDGMEAVVVRFTGVELRSRGQTQSFPVNPPKSIDLLQLQGSLTESLLEAVKIQEGEYQQIRFLIDSTEPSCRNLSSEMGSFVQMEGTRYPLVVPGGQGNELVLTSRISIEPDSDVEYVVDFDLRRSVVETPGKPCYTLRPAFRTVAVAQSGVVGGVVDGRLLEAEHCLAGSRGQGAAVYAFEKGAPITDMSPGRGPLSSDGLVFEAAQGRYTYEIGFLPAGDYTLALSCSAAADDPDTVDNVHFDAVISVTVKAGQEHTADFTATP